MSWPLFRMYVFFVALFLVFRKAGPMTAREYYVILLLSIMSAIVQAMYQFGLYQRGKGRRK